MRVILAGGNGYIGRNLTRVLKGRGDTVVWLSHRPGRAHALAGSGPDYEVAFDPHESYDTWTEEIAGADAVLNLSGYPIASRWNGRVKHLLRDSRIETGRALVGRIADLPASQRPAVFVSASGIGYYGDRGDDVLAEDEPAGGDWLAQLAVDWEHEATRVAEHGVRCVTVRTGPVVGTEGLVPRMALPFRLFVGGPIGSGRQFFSWIHIDDIVGVYARAIDDVGLEGPVNANAEPLRMREFAAAMGRVLHRPSWLPVPRFALRIALGQVADYTLMSQRADNSKLRSRGFRFAYPNAVDALRDVLGS